MPRCAHRLGGPWRLPENVRCNESQRAKKSPLRYTLTAAFRQGFRGGSKRLRMIYEEAEIVLDSAPPRPRARAQKRRPKSMAR